MSGLLRNTCLLLVFAGLFLTSHTKAQSQLIRGRVTDVNSGEAVPYCNVYLKNAKKGTISDLDGFYTIQVSGIPDSLIFSNIGYISQRFYTPNIKGKELNIKLEASTVNLGEIEVKPKRSRAYMLLKMIQENEKTNNPELFNGFMADEYNRTTIMFTNIDAKYKNSAALKNAKGGFIDYNDSATAIPVLIAEEMNQFIIPSDGSARVNRRLNEYTKSFDMFNGVDITHITREMTQSQNYYNAYISVLGRSFASPLSLTSRFFYKMWVSDSIMSDTNKLIKVTFAPRREKDLAFYGYFWVEDSTYAIAEIKVDLSPKANINHVQDYRAHNIYQKHTDGKWYYKTKKTELIFDLAITNDTTKKMATYVSKTTGFKNIQLTDKNNFEDTARILSRKQQELKADMDEDPIFWEQQRFVNLDTTEQKIAVSIDSLKDNSFVKAFDKAVRMGLIGYWEAGKLDIGPYNDFYRNNAIEGDRITFTARTGRKFNQYYSVGGYLGYGFLDQKFKYGGNFRYYLNWRTYSVLGVDAWDDIRRIGHNENMNLIRENAYGTIEDNAMSILYINGPNDKLSRKQWASFWIEHDLRDGVTLKTKLIGSVTHQGPFVPFYHDDQPVTEIKQVAVSTYLRLAFKETYIKQYFMRVYMGQKRPIINLNAEAGFTSSAFHNEPYLKLHMCYWHRTPVGMGSLLYIVEAGKYFGKLPYTHLEVARGNQTYGYSRYSFNMLNYMEYVSDTYANLYSAYDFGGLIMNKLPLLKFLNFRELVSFKGFVGQLSSKNTEILTLPNYTGEVPNAYAEVGVGFTNVLRYGRIEYVWRLTDRNKDNINTEGVRFRFEFNF